MFDQLINVITSYFDAGCPCLFHMVTGYYCPGCGGTRAVIALMHGHVIRSFIFHPLVPYAAIACVVLFIMKLKDPQKSIEAPMVRALIIALAIIIINFAVKNILLFNGIDLLN